MSKKTEQPLVEILVGSRLFQEIDRDLFVPPLESCQRMIVQSNEVVIHPGQDNTVTYMVLEGKLSIHLEKLSNCPIRKVGVGETVGELSLLGETKATAFVLANRPTELLVIPRELMWDLIRKSAGIAQNLLFILTDWIVTDNERYISRSREVEALKGLSQLDGLTGLANRRTLDQVLNRIYSRSQMNGIPFSIIMMDVDHFKKYNDQNGHLGGDQALMALATTIKATVRPADFPARYGGEEFAVVLPNTTAKEAFGAAERLRKAIETMKIDVKGGGSLPSITVSLGIAQSSEENNTIEKILEAADKRLYKAKEQGRNQSCHQ